MTLPTQSAKRKAAIKSGELKTRGTFVVKASELQTRGGAMSKKVADTMFGKAKRARKSLKAGRKPTGEAKVFGEIWEERPHECEVCGAEIIEATAKNFSHILPKGSYRRLRLDKLNIFLKCELCHDRWHQFGATGFRYSFQWRHVVQRHDELKLAYHQRLSAELSGKA